MSNTGNQRKSRLEDIGCKYAAELFKRKGCKVELRGDTKNILEVLSLNGADRSKMQIQTDDRAKQSENIGVTMSRNINGSTLPAGPFVSPADYFVFVIAGEPGAYFIETSELSQLISDKAYDKVVTQGSGEYNLAVFNKQVLLDHCKQIDSPARS